MVIHIESMEFLSLLEAARLVPQDRRVPKDQQDRRGLQVFKALQDTE
jgi:hypothetical protein